MSQRILDALSKLDAENSNHWTAEGLPRIDTVRLLAGDQGLSREDISKAAPEFSREQARVGAPQGQGAVATGTGTSNTPIAAPALAQGPAVTDNESLEDTSDEELPEGDELDDQIARGQKYVSELAADIAKAQAHLREAVAELDKLIDAQSKAQGSDTTSKSIRGYLDSQTKLLEQRGQRQKVLRESGFGAKELRELLNNRAPIDVAMARKSSRGSNRPGGK